MKKRLSLLAALSLAIVTVSGCEALDNFFGGETETPTEQEENQNTEPENQEGQEGEGEGQQGGGEGQQGQGEEQQPVKRDHYNVTFNANGGTGSMDPDVTEGTTYYVTKDCEFTYLDHAFNGWALNDPQGDVFALGDMIYNIEDDITLYATWIALNYKVTFNANGGVGTMSDKETNGSRFVIPNCTFTYENHTFSYWTLHSVYGTRYDTGETITDIHQNITLYAHWEENTIPQTNYTVTFNGNGGEGAMSSQTTNGSSFVVPECAFTRENYSFKNWAYESKNGVEYSPGETIKNIEKDITLYALWSENSGPIDPENPDIPAGYYSQCEGLSGSALQAKLKSINPAKNPSYDWSRYEDADEAEDDPNSILCLYTRHNIAKSSHCGNYAWDKWNREHIWTQSAYPASASDNHNIFACEGQINNYRGNKPYAEGGSVVVVFGHTTGCKQTSDTFEPCDEAKGEVARSVMYGTVMYSYTMTQEIESIELALKWHLEHPITTRDTKRNNVVYGNQGNRNPFVDHPEYACKIWGGTNSATRALCGM